MKKILWTGVLAAVLMIAVSMVLNVIYGWMFPSFASIYADTAIFRAMDDPLMVTFWFYPIALGIGLAWIWSRAKEHFSEDSTFWAGLKFGWAYFVVAAIPAFFINVSSFNLPVMMIATWTEMSLANGFIAGWVFAKWAR